MKLVLCRECGDVVRLWVREPRQCHCGQSGGEYVDELNATYWGEAVPLGFSNRSLAKAVARQPKRGPGTEFVAFVIPRRCTVMEKIDE